METQDTISDVWWLDEFLEITEPQPEAPMDPDGSDTTFGDSTGANPASGEISADLPSTHAVNLAPLNNTYHEFSDLFVTDDHNPFHELHPENTAVLADEPLYGTVPIGLQLCGTTVDEIELRLKNLEQAALNTHATTVSTQNAIKGWSATVNKTLLEIAKAVGIPLHYQDDMVYLQPSYESGAYIHYTSGEPSGEKQVTK